MYTFLKSYCSYCILILTLLFTLGCSDSDSNRFTPSSPPNTNPDPEINVDPVANAGADQHILENTRITLDASASQDSDGQITQYKWVQVFTQNAPTLTITNSGEKMATVAIPVLQQDKTFVFKLTVTDDKGASNSDQVEVHVRKVPSVIFGSISGNTANFQSKARFNARLSSKPIADVNIALSSSDPTEGTPDVNSLTFTSSNFSQTQTISVTGQNPNVLAGSQNYNINFELTSEDPLYNGLTVAAVNLQGVALNIDSLRLSAPFLAGVRGTALPIVSYTGSRPLVYSLTAAPAGMVIDTTTGVITWTPSTSDGGTTVSLTLEVSDGVLTTQKVLSLLVVQPTPITVAITTSMVTVNDPNTNLNGLSISNVNSATRGLTSNQQTRAVQDLKLSVVPTSGAPVSSGSMHKLSDVFYVVGSDDNGLTLSFTIDELPNSVTQEDVHLYVYIQPAGSDQAYWSPVALFNRYSTTSSGETLYQVNVDGMQGLFVWGYHKTSSALASTTDVTAQSATRVDVPIIAGCVSVEPVGSGDYKCSSALFPGVSVFIDHFGTGMRWSGMSAQELASSVLVGQGLIRDIGLPVQSQIIINIEPMMMGQIAYVSDDPSENFKVIHLTDDNSVSKEEIQIALIHATGHQLVYRFAADLAIDTGISIESFDWKNPTLVWAIEAFATWLEDQVLDDVNSYRGTVTPISRILEKGLPSSDGDGKHGFALIKLLQSHCPKLLDNIKVNIESLVTAVLSGQSASDIQQIVTTALVNAECDFGPQLGTSASDRAHISSAALLYQVASLLKQDISLLDPNEAKEESDFVPSPYVFTQGSNLWLSNVEQWLSREAQTPYKLNGIELVPPLGAYSFVIDSITGTLPDDKQGYFKIETPLGQVLLVSVTSEDAVFTGKTQIIGLPHVGFLNILANTFTYDFSGKVPKLFVTILNPSPVLSVTVSQILFNIGDNTIAAPTITMPTAGSRIPVGNLTLTGTVDNSMRLVTIISGDIRYSVTPAADGSFRSQIAIVAGENLITVKGSGDLGRHTKTASLTVTGT